MRDPLEIAAELETLSGLTDKDVRVHAEAAACIREMHEALQAILAEPDGCPQCDYGKLRANKPHWPECGFAKAQALTARTPETTP